MLEVSCEALINGGTIRFEFVDGFVPQNNFEIDFVSAHSITIDPSVKFDFSGVPEDLVFLVEDNGTQLSFHTLSRCDKNSRKSVKGRKSGRPKKSRKSRKSEKTGRSRKNTGHSCRPG